MTIPNSTYRLQLRNGVDFATAQGLLPYLRDMAISHLYLSPIFAAQPGSTHGYDVTDPTAIEAELGGRDGFEALAHAARDAGIGIIIDIVPNHTAFSPHNPWLHDVLRHGRNSTYASAFDIDWDAGPLVLPFLPDPFEIVMERGDFAVEGDEWVMGDLRLPLAPGPRASNLRDVHATQNWRLVHYERERDSITHRRFFNVTGLIGMRVERQDVFDLTHSLILDLVRQGLVQGLRVDHIDGLVDPAGYLDRLHAAAPDTPIWVEKILVGDEVLPPEWPVAGTTGYEAARLYARALTDARGLHDLDRLWRDASDIDEGFPDALRAAKHDILDNELAAERRQLIALARDALSARPEGTPGPEWLREAVTALLVAMPRYRSYVAPGGVGDADRDLLRQVADHAARGLRSRTVIDALTDALMTPCAFTQRFQQVSGALLAKAQEDTAGFRWTRYLAANEVGAEPDEATITDDRATAFLRARASSEMNLTSTHDTKRSEDSRMRLVAISHLPQEFMQLYRAAAALPQAVDVPGRRIWYGVQSALAIHGAPDADARLCAHLEKAMREAKLRSFWTNPDELAEGQAKALTSAVLDSWRDAPPALEQLLARADALVLMQLLMKMLTPGFPDIYRGTESQLLALTDPDNRHPVDWDALRGATDTKARWTRDLLHLRRDRAAFLKDADVRLERDENGMRMIRSLDGRTLTACMAREMPAGDAILSWQGQNGDVIALIEGSAATG
ncbi:malto-oligosyltrehalose synthase [Paracoccus sp. 1_MG-2023]|uniref:malto-oligosyltrehalose synthase n=1 Tax=unclassified Paracoccus (in: a-proteobacteria) TaxID=2688777 RepID=UPI001C0A0DD1|nr:MULTISPECIES: malto-oligosyltrehalose synthase [unclassified Paracoccus (in: a-proteobacteria)]MBU2956083.1 malto-oligosyltrehalose synthase [Paracoccus sp. C2R09]MDO6669489.1 malto-oligosyltrehalose synthase [Paracoccus sp. 1_MG-2023]